MKKLISLLTASALMLGLAACGDFAPDPTASQETALDFEYTEESFPEVWAGRSAAPLMEAVAAIMLGTGRAEGAERISFAATDEVWAALGRGEAALAVAPEGSEMPSGIDAAPISRDALVFFVGEGGDADLSSEELERIFSGRGGDGLEILTRPEGSGSVAALSRLIGCDEALVAGESRPMTGSNVIGFGFWSECVLAGLADGYQLVSVDGVEPTAQSISSGEYPLALDLLAGVSSGAAEDSPERALWLWLQGGVGQAFISSQGYLEAA